MRGRHFTAAAFSNALRETPVTLGFPFLLGILAALTAVRLIGLKMSAVDLFYDEAQYWDWSRQLAFGYFSKPPLLAWIIAVAERVCGDAEACIRAPAPILYLGTSLLVYPLTRQLYDSNVAFFATLATAMMTGLVYSAQIISTDVPLMFFWALAMLAYFKLLAGSRYWSIVLGIALGLGFLAKYAMVYFLLGVALAAWFDIDARRLLRRPEFWVAMAIALLIIAPNIIWNIENGLATLRHTGKNIQGRGIDFNPLHALEFIAAQFAVLGPVVFTVFLMASFRVMAPDLDRADRMMLAFAIPPLALVTTMAFFTRVNANWAAPSGISAIVVATAILVRWKAWRWLVLSLAIGLIAQLGLLIGDAKARTLHLPWLAKGDLYSRTLGWHALADEAGQFARRVGARTIIAERRRDVAALLYYRRQQPEKIVTWRHSHVPLDHFEMSRPLDETSPQPLILITECASNARLSTDFATVEPLGSFSVKTGPTSVRTYFAFKLDDRRGPIGALGPCD